MEKTILFVDDDIYDILNLYGEILEEKGYAFVPHHKGEDAIAAIRGGLKYDLAVVDMALEFKEDGKEVIKISKQINPRTCVIAMSGYRMLVPQADKVFHKSCQVSEITDYIDSYFSNSKQSLTSKSI